MTDITKYNIDEWLFNHFEGNLNLEEQFQLTDFLEANPQFNSDLELWSNMRVDEPEMEYPHMQELLVDEAAEVALAGAGIGAIGVSTWARWGVGAIAAVGILFLGYQATESGVDESNVDTASIIALDDNSGFTTNNGEEIVGANSFEGVQNNPYFEDLVASNSNGSFLPWKLLPQKPEGNTVWEFDPNMAINHLSAPSYTNQNYIHPVINTNNPTIIDPLNQLPNVVFHYGPNGEVIVGPDPKQEIANNELASDVLAENAEAFREEGFYVNRTRNLSGDRSNSGSFNDPEWGRKVLSTPADPDGDGIRNNGHERAPSYSSLPPSGVWPFLVPHNGVGFNNEDRRPQFIVPENNLLGINAALAGNQDAGVHRIELNARTHLPNDNFGGHSAQLSYDTYAEGLRGGIGILAYHRNVGQGMFTQTHASFMYAPKLMLSNKRTSFVSITPAIRVGYTQNQVKANFISESPVLIEPQPGQLVSMTQGNSGAGVGEKSHSYQDIAAGVHLNTNRMYAGISADHLTRPMENIYDLSSTSEERVSIEYTAYIGTDFKRKDYSKFVYSPSLLVTSQGNRNEAWLSNTFRYNWMTAGFGVSTNQSMRGMIGLTVDRLMVQYNYDLTPSDLYQQNVGGHELGLRWLIK